ncbi:hypothetical protein ACJQWK_09143 [Exserohilum turcicum]
MEPPGASNATSYMSSPADLLMALPRILSKVSSLGDMMRSGGSVIAEPTANLTNSTITPTAAFVQSSYSTVAAAAAATPESDMTVWQALRNVATWFSYITSKWAIATFAIAILLNRTHFYGNSRVPLSFDRLHMRLTLYIVPLLLFLYQISNVLRAIRCQTSPGWSDMQYGASDRHLDTDFGGEGGCLWRLASMILFWETTEESCQAVNMLPVDAAATRESGSLALLWPMFLTLGFGQFVDTLACALQGRRPIQEVGMTLFEHSLAFAEAEAVVTRPLAVDSTRFFKPKSVFTPDGTSLTLPRSRLSQIANVPPEVLLISLISSVSHFTSNLLAIAGVRSKYRLLTTTVWGLAYISAFAWSFARLTWMVADPDQYVGILRFPTVCIIGFIPHLLIIVGITLCGLVYLLALLITALSLPAGQGGSRTLRERFAAAYGNLHANIHLSSITPLTINWHEDFYTTILKVGYVILTAASEAVFLNEGVKINVHSMTWLEKQRLQEILARRRKRREMLVDIPSELRNDTFTQGAEVVDQLNDVRTDTATSGYAKERKTRGAKSSTEASTSMGQNDPALQQRSRYVQAYGFFVRISRLLILSVAKVTGWLLMKVGISYRPGWLTRAAGAYEADKIYTSASRTNRSQCGTAGLAGQQWLTMDDRSRVRQDPAFDIEVFAKERLRQSGFYSEPDTEDSEERLNDYLYAWWRNGGLWNEVDNSRDYSVAQDDDTTSVMSFATTTDNDEWSDIDDGQRTPTRDTYRRSREETPSVDDALDFSRLSRLLDPRTREDREEAKLLSRHLQSPNIMTRSQYRKALEQEEAKILTTSRYKMESDVAMSPEEEEQLLEDLILNRRSATAPQASNAGSWDTGAEGMGSEGPQCVVCQMAPRTVLVWPCGCLSLCDDCRVGLASKNYTTCVCCRTNVAAYSRLYVP